MPLTTLYDRIKSALGTWRRSRGGNVAIIFGLAAIPMVIVSGIGVDMARLYAMRIRVEAALDAAALAVGASNPTNFTTAQLQTEMQAFFTANYPTAALGTPGTPLMSLATTGNNNVINFTVTATLPTTFMRLANINTLSVTVSNQVTRGATGLEVALVLDNTGSMMCGDGYPNNCAQNVPPSHMDTLRTDAQNIVDTLFAASPDISKLKMSVVPYVTAVNVGPALVAPLGSNIATNTKGNYLDYNNQIIKDVNGNPITYDSSQSPTSQEWIGCVVEPTTAGEDTSGAGPDIMEPAGGWTPETMGASWTPYYWQSGNNSSYSGFSQSGIYNTWNLPTTSKVNGVTTTTQHPKVQYVEVNNGDYSTDSNGAIQQSYGPNLGCPTPLVRLTNDQTVLDAAVSGQISRANSGTAITVGMVWGWRTLAHELPFGDGQPTNTPGWLKAVVLETDGNAEVLPTPDYTSYGYIDTSLKLGSSQAGNFPPNGNPAPGTANYNLANRLTTLCNNMKTAGIIIYTIGLGIGAQNTQLQNCAGPSPGAFYAAPTASSLTTAFQQVANSLNQLRLSK
jgi:Flp pilus assembly protein TadG